MIDFQMSEFVANPLTIDHCKGSHNNPNPQPRKPPFNINWQIPIESDEIGGRRGSIPSNRAAAVGGLKFFLKI